MYQLSVSISSTLNKPLMLVEGGNSFFYGIVSYLVNSASLILSFPLFLVYSVPRYFMLCITCRYYLGKSLWNFSDSSNFNTSFAHLFVFLIKLAGVIFTLFFLYLFNHVCKGGGTQCSIKSENLNLIINICVQLQQ